MKKGLLVAFFVALFFLNGCSDIIVYPGDGPEIEESGVTIDFDLENYTVTVDNSNDVGVYVWIGAFDDNLQEYIQKFDTRVDAYEQNCEHAEFESGDNLKIKIVLDGYEPIIKFYTLEY